jgi:hypothetical protein
VDDTVQLLSLSNLGRNCLLAFVLMAWCFASSAQAQVALDINSETAKGAADKKTLDDLAVNDTALLYENLFRTMRFTCRVGRSLLTWAKTRTPQVV